MKRKTVIKTAIAAIFAVLCLPGLVSAKTATELELTRSVEKAHVPVVNTFKYEIKALDSKNPETVSGYPTSFSITFDAVEPDMYHRATASNKLDFANASFSKPGFYYFEISEVESQNSEAYPIDEKKLVAIVTVENNNEVGASSRFKFSVADLVYLDDFDTNSTKIAAVFEGSMRATYIQLNAKTEGNVADKDQYFKYKVKLTGSALKENMLFTIKNQDGTVIIDGGTAPIRHQYIVGDESNFIYLKNGQTVTIGLTNDGYSQIPVGTQFELEKVSGNDYESFFDGSERASSSRNAFNLVAMPGAGASDTERENFDKINLADVVNVKNASVATGVNMVVLPFLALAGIALTSFVVIRRTARN